MLFYLSGAIEYAPDRGTGWRAEISPFLQSLGHSLYDPAADRRKNLTEQEARDFRSWKRTDLPRFQRTVRKIIAWDLDWIEHKAECVLAYWDEHAARGAGSQAEITAAHRRGIPVYLVCAMPLADVSGWVLGCASQVFTSFDEFRQFLLSQQETTENPSHAARSAQAS
jgi:hypothetical protein